MTYTKLNQDYKLGLITKAEYLLAISNKLGVSYDNKLTVTLLDS